MGVSQRRSGLKWISQTTEGNTFVFILLYKLIWRKTVHSISLNYSFLEVDNWPATGWLPWLPTTALELPIRCACRCVYPGRKASIKRVQKST